LNSGQGCVAGTPRFDCYLFKDRKKKMATQLQQGQPDSAPASTSTFASPQLDSERHSQDGAGAKELHRHETHRDTDPEHLTAIQSARSHVEAPATLPSEIFFVFIICMAQFMTQTGLSLSIPTAHIIGKSFNTEDPGQLSWFAAAYSLTVGTFILVAGRLGDLYGHKLMFVIGFCWYGVWSLLAGFSVWSNAIFFNCCRAFQGIGPAMLLPNGIAILGRAYPSGPKKGMMFSLFGAAAPSGFVVGGTFVAIFSQLVWWPWSYWVMGMVCFLFAFLALFAIPRTRTPRHQDNHSALVRIDAWGAVTGISGLVLINFAWNQAPLVGWQNPYTYVLLIVGLALLGVFTFVERRAPCPLLPRSIFTGELAWVLGCIAAGWSSFGIFVYYYYQFMETIKGDTPLLVLAKWAFAPITGAMAAMATGFLLGRVPASVIMFCAMSAFTIGLALTATIPVGQTYWAQAFVAVLITPWGM
jgi:MFS family permease